MNSNSFTTTPNNCIIMNNSYINENITIPQTKKYWCHICKKSFSHLYEENSDIKCVYCNKTFCELLNTEDETDPTHPVHFEPFILNNASNSENNTSNNNNTINYDINHLNELLDRRNQLNESLARRVRLLNLIQDFMMIRNNNNNFDNILNQIFINDTNKYGNPPASKDAVNKLKKIKINEEKMKEFGVENSCAVCKDEFNIGEECILMPCAHHFHEDCLLPWLKERNSCPVCRYELPTDDKDFEEMKKFKLNRENNAVNNDNIQ